MIPSSPRLASTSSTSVTLSSPFGPFTFTIFPSIVAVTPFGSGTGLLPMRDISLSRSEHVAEDFAADVFLARRGVRHHALRRRHDRDTEPIAVRFEVCDSGIDAPTRGRHTLELADHRPALVIFE